MGERTGPCRTPFALGKRLFQIFWTDEITSEDDERISTDEIISETDLIAIIGIACKFPGCNNIEEYWRLLRDGKNHVVEIPGDRWNIDAFYNSDPNAPGKMYVRQAGFVDRIYDWDHRLYGINDMEAELIDPQQRLVLDCIHMALEDAGLTKKDIDGSNTSVIIGSMTDDYKSQVMDDTTINSTYSVTGTHNSIISARPAYIYNLNGPALTIDSACSSSLVAIDIALEKIHSGISDMAICGGVNVLMDPQLFIALCRARMLSPTGQCRTFTKDADGYARGEGCGIVILKSLQKAKADGNKIWGTIRTGTNQDGHMAMPITAPSSVQQQKLIENVYRRYAVDKARIQVIEAHGTGTAIGDPAEIEALGSQFGKACMSKRVVHIGSVKTNIGHLEAAAGVASVIKVLLMMRNEQIVPSLFYTKDNENPKLKLSEKGFVVPTELSLWECSAEETRIACVNSFGFGGTNAHAVIKEYKQASKPITKHHTVLPYIVVISAFDEKGLEESLNYFKISLESKPYNIASLSCTSTCKRDHRPKRAAMFGKTQNELIRQCDNLLKTQTISKTFISAEKRIIFVFCGVGTSWNGMCTELMKIDAFQTAVNEVDRHLQPLVGWSIANTFKESCDINSVPIIAHIAIFACQVGLAALWAHFGVKPDAIVGQSVGEVAAAYVADYIDLETAVKIIYLRSRYLAVVTKGTMALIQGLDTQIVETYCRDKYFRKDISVSVAVYNSPVSCTVAGTEEGITGLTDEVFQKYPEATITNIPVKCAYHSHVVADASLELGKELRGIEVKAGKVQVFSTVTGDRISKEVNFASSGYWERNVKLPVLFKDAISKSVVKDKHNIFVEIGPAPVLRTHFQNIFEEKSRCSVFSSMKKSNEISTLTETMCALFCHGVVLNWNAFLPCQQEITDIPKYMFQKQRHLYMNPRTITRNQGFERPITDHMFVEQLPQADGTAHFNAKISETLTPFVYEHIISDSVIIPGALLAESGFEIARKLMGESKERVSVSLDFLRPVKCEYGEKIDLDISTFTQNGSILFHVTRNKIAICKGWVCANNQVPLQKRRENIDSLKLFILREKCTQIKSNEIYLQLEAIGFKYGQSFRMMTECLTNGTESLTTVCVPNSVMEKVDFTTIHPCILDVMFQSTINSTSHDLQNEIKQKNMKFMPVAIEDLRVWKKPKKTMYIYTKRTNTTYLETVFQVHYNIILMDCEGVVIAGLQNYTTYGKKKNTPFNAPCELKYQLTWLPLKKPNHPQKSTPKILALTNTYGISVSTELEDVENIRLHQNNDSIYTQEYVEKSFKDEQNNFIDVVLLIIKQCHSLEKILSPEDAEFINTAVKENCMLVTDIVRYMTDKKISAPLYIVTQNTQPSFVMETAEINLFGQEVWGFVRSVHMEFLHGEITLVDLQPSLKETKADLLRFIASTYDKMTATNPEIVIRKNEVFAAQFSKMPRWEAIPLVRAEMTCNAEMTHVYKIFASQPESVFLSDFTQNEVKKESYIMVRIRCICFHPIFIKPITSCEKEINLETWKQPMNPENAIYALEYIGSAGKHNSNTSETLGVDEQEEIIAIFPSEINTEMYIPEQCTVKLKDLPFYQPGLLLYAMINWKLISCVPDNANVTIFSRYPNELAYMITQEMLKDRRNAQVYSLEDNVDLIEIDVLLSLEPLDPSFRFVRNCKRIICLEENLDEPLRSWISRSEEIKVETHSTKHLLRCTNVEKDMPHVVLWLQMHLQSIVPLLKSNMTQNHLDKDKTHWSLPCRTIDILEKGKLNVPVCNPLSKLFSRYGVYIVTGGLTGLGWEIVKLIGEMGAGTIAILSRQKHKTNIEIQKEEKKNGSRIVSVTCDVTDLKSVQNAISEIEDQSNDSQIKGIFHCAGVLQGQLLFNLDESSTDVVLKPKVLGTINLHIATQYMDLDYFVVSSSISSIIGSPGQNSYGAANSFLDIFMKWRRGRGMVGQAINWGSLSVGMAARPDFKNNFEKRGFNLLSCDEIRSCFKEVLMQNSTSVIYADVNWDLFLNDFKNERQVRPLKQMIVLFKETASSTIDFETISKDNLSFDFQFLKTKSETDQREAIEKLVVEITKKVIGGCSDEISHSKTLEDIGFDSMSTITFINIVASTTSYKIDREFMLDTSRTIEQIEHLLYDNIFREKENVEK